MNNKMSNETFYGGKVQDWTARFDVADAASSSFGLLSAGVLRIGTVDTEVVLDSLPWAAEAEYHPSWRLRFLSLKWLSPLIWEAMETESAKPSRIPVIAQVAKHWVDWHRTASATEKEDHWNGHTAALRASTLVSVSSLLEADWLRAAILEHGLWLLSEENWDGAWNHGFMQSIALLGVGLRLGSDTFCETAIARIGSALELMIDEQGCTNEQAPAYAVLVYELLQQLSHALDSNALQIPEFRIRARQELLADFIVNAGDPSGNLVQLGDSFKVASDAAGIGNPVRPVMDDRAKRPRVAVYDGGFIFGRSGWGTARPETEESFYSIRFGPQRIIHGHNDHMSVTLYDAGRHVIVDSGHNGYVNNEYRAHLRSIAAHNVLSVRGMRHDWSAETTLLRKELHDESQFFELEDSAFRGLKRRRSVLAAPQKPLVVLDRTSGSTDIKSYDQFWHLSPTHHLISAQPGRVVFGTSEGDVSTHIISYEIINTGITRPNVAYWRGSLEPHQGWHSTKDGENIPAPVVSFQTDSQDLILATCIVTVPSSDSVNHSLRPGRRGWLILRVVTKTEEWTWRISRGGYVGLNNKH